MGIRYLSIIQEAIDIYHIYKRPFHTATDSIVLSGWREKSLKGNRIATNSHLEHLCPGLHAGGVEDDARYSLLQGHMLDGTCMPHAGWPHAGWNLADSARETCSGTFRAIKCGNRKAARKA